MTLENVVWLLAGWIATNAVLAAAWARWRRPRHPDPQRREP